MCSVCPPPSLPSPNWGGLTSWPELNWVVVPVASVSFPVSQGGLHSHCVRHCIVQAGCNQADESRISRNTLRAFKCLRSAARYPHTRSKNKKECTVITHTHVVSLYSLTQQEFIWWIRKSCWEFVMFCLFMSIKSLVLRRCCVALAAHVAINLFFSFCLCVFFFFFAPLSAEN